VASDDADAADSPVLQVTPPDDEEDDEDEGVDDGDEDAEEVGDGDANFTLDHITVCAYGVLGLNDLGRRAGVDPAAAVAERFVLVDPAGLNYVRNGRRGAGGVSEVLYDWLGWGPDGQFPRVVANQLASEGDATFYTYPANVSSVHGPADFAVQGRDAQIIHVISPQLHQREGAHVVDALATAYTEVFREAGLAGLGATGVLRLSMLSAIVNDGDWRDDISAVTVLALVQAASNVMEMDEVYARTLLQGRVELCAFSDCAAVKLNQMLRKWTPGATVETLVSGAPDRAPAVSGRCLRWQLLGAMPLVIGEPPVAALFSRK
jgi:hypothetical protein